MAFIEASDGIQIYAEAHGDGIPVVFSCGFATTSANFLPQVEPLVAAGARVILWDFRGHGRSQPAKTPDGYTLEQVVDDLGRVLDWAAPRDSAVVGGLSLGGLVSLHFALGQRARVRALLLIDSGPGFKDPDALARWTAQSEKMGERFEREGLRAFIESRASATAIGRFRELPAAQAAADAIARQDARALAEFARRIVGPAPGVIDQLGELTMPALVVVGAEDKAYLRASEVMAAKLPRARRVVIPDAGHIVNIERADAFNAAVEGFLAELRS